MPRSPAHRIATVTISEIRQIEQRYIAALKIADKDKREAEMRAILELLGAPAD